MIPFISFFVCFFTFLLMPALFELRVKTPQNNNTIRLYDINIFVKHHKIILEKEVIIFSIMISVLSIFSCKTTLRVLNFT